MTRHNDDREAPMRGPFEWLMGVSIALLVAAIALTLAVQLIIAIWPWLVLIGAIGGGLYAAIWWHFRSRRRW